MNNDTRICLHLGVHKSASTHLQSRLSKSKQALNSQGIQYIDLYALRDMLTDRLVTPTPDKEQILNKIAPYMTGKSLIISDENILGLTESFINQFIYPKAKNRLTKFRNIFSDNIDNTHVYITLRTFSDYLISRYFEFLRHFRFMKFRDFLNPLDIEKITWKPLLNQIHALGYENIYVTDFSDALVNNGDDYIHQIIGQAVKLENAENKPWVKKSKLSAQAYKILELYAQDFPDNTKDMMRLLDVYPQTTPKKAFQPFSEDELGILHQRYKQDIYEIKNDPRFKYLTFK